MSLVVCFMKSSHISWCNPLQCSLWLSSDFSGSDVFVLHFRKSFIFAQLHFSPPRIVMGQLRLRGFWIRISNEILRFGSNGGILNSKINMRSGRVVNFGSHFLEIDPPPAESKLVLQKRPPRWDGRSMVRFFSRGISFPFLIQPFLSPLSLLPIGLQKFPVGLEKPSRLLSTRGGNCPNNVNWESRILRIWCWS